MKTETHTITPEAAAKLLAETNQENPRLISRRVINQYAEDMKSGLWQTTHQGIAFTGESLAQPGKLVDGQHRLAAIVSVGFPVSMVVTFGAPRANKIDFGLKRQLYVVTGISRDNLAVASVIISAITGTNPTPTQKQLLCEQYPDLGEMCSLTHHVSFITRAPIHAAFIVAKHAGIKEAQPWYVQLVRNDIDMPIAMRGLRYKLEKDFKALYSTLLRRSPAYAIALRAIRAASQGRPVDKLYADPVLEKLPEYDGEIGKFVRENLI
jgi:hypothetical protein